jgi:hypothetical protein
MEAIVRAAAQTPSSGRSKASLVVQSVTMRLRFCVSPIKRK